MFQMLQPTFEANKLPGHDNILDAVDNTAAAILYIQKKFGHPSKIPTLTKENYEGY
jgi:SLT domain-containing protein